MPKYKNTDAYIEDHNGRVGDLLNELRSFIHQVLPSATEGMDYGVPIFLNSHGVPVLYIIGAKDHVNFGFLRFDDLSDTEGVLKGSGKPSKHVEIIPGQAINKGQLSKFIAECARIKS